jgi:integrase
MDGLWGLMQELVDLRGKIAESEIPTLSLELLARWTYKPERIDLDACGAKEARLDTAGPPIPDCREQLQRYYREWRAASRQRSYLKHRRLILSAILWLYGPREDALRLVDVADYLPDHLLRDGQRGPVLRTFPGKTVDDDQPHFLPLPAELAAWIEEWIVFTGRQVGQAGQPLWPGRQPKPGAQVRRISVSGFYAAIAGRPGSKGHGSSYALIPRADNPFEGFNPHSFRHTAYQAAKRAGERAKQADPYRFGNVDAEDFARAVCGHDLNQTVSDTYNNLRQAELARAAIDYAWQDLWAAGKRYGLDPQEIIEARHQLDTLTAGVAALDGELRLLHHQQTQLATGSRELEGDQLHATLIESNRLTSDMHLKTTDLTRLTEKQDRARQRLEQALITEVALPDELDPAQHQVLLTEALQQSADRPVDDDLPLADHYTVSDLTEIFDVREQTINRWYRDGAPTGQQPWNPDGWIDEGLRKKRLQADALNLDTLTETQRKRAVVVRQRRAARQRAPVASAS